MQLNMNGIIACLFQIIVTNYGNSSGGEAC